MSRPSSLSRAADLADVLVGYGIALASQFAVVPAGIGVQARLGIATALTVSALSLIRAHAAHAHISRKDHAWAAPRSR